MPRRTSANRLRLNHHSHAVHAVPEVTQRIPARHHRLRVAAVVPGACEERQVTEALRLVVERESAPGVAVAARTEARALPAHALVHRDLDEINRADADPGAAAHGDEIRALDARI